MHNLINVSFPEQQYIYGVRRGKEKTEGGLFIYEAENCFRTDCKQESYKLTDCSVSLRGFLDCNIKEQRLAFMKSLSTIEVLPIPHLNTIPFQNFPERKDIVCTKRDHDMFSVFTFEGILYTWNITNGVMYEPVKALEKLGL